MMVALADRVRYVQAFRVALVAIVAGAWLLVPAVGDVPARDVLAPLVPYTLLAVLGGLAWRSSGHRMVQIFRNHGFRWTYGRSDNHHFDG